MSPESRMTHTRLNRLGPLDPRGETDLLVSEFLTAKRAWRHGDFDVPKLREGLISVVDVEMTAVGWGLVAEADASYGYVSGAVISPPVGVAKVMASRGTPGQKIGGKLRHKVGSYWIEDSAGRFGYAATYILRGPAK